MLGLLMFSTWQALARESGANFICLRPSMLQSKWYGETQKLVQATFTLAYKLQPCIIFVGAPLLPPVVSHTVIICKKLLLAGSLRPYGNTQCMQSCCYISFSTSWHHRLLSSLVSQPRAIPSPSIVAAENRYQNQHSRTQHRASDVNLPVFVV